jgi:hypothetical protein
MKRMKKFSGTWSLPFTVEKAQTLKDIVDWIERGGIKDIVMGKLYDTYGDDELFDEIEIMIDRLSEELAEIIKEKVAVLIDDYDSDPESFKDKMSGLARKILEELVR